MEVSSVVRVQGRLELRSERAVAEQVEFSFGRIDDTCGEDAWMCRTLFAEKKC